MTEQEMLARIAELEEAVKMLNELWSNEFQSHRDTQEYVIKLQKRLLGIKDESE